MVELRKERWRRAGHQQPGNHGADAANRVNNWPSCAHHASRDLVEDICAPGHGLAREIHEHAANRLQHADRVTYGGRDILNGRNHGWKRGACDKGNCRGKHRGKGIAELTNRIDQPTIAELVNDALHLWLQLIKQRLAEGSHQERPRVR